MNKLIGMKELQKRLDLSRNTIMKYIYSGELTFIDIAKNSKYVRYKFTEEGIKEFISKIQIKYKK